LNIAIVVSEFNNEVTSRMHKVALEKSLGIPVVDPTQAAAGMAISTILLAY